MMGPPARLSLAMDHSAVVYAWYIHLFVPTDYVVMYIALSLHTFVPTYLYLCIHLCTYIIICDVEYRS